jgi:hypothetical protein
MLRYSIMVVVALASCQSAPVRGVSKEDDAKASAELLKAKLSAAQATLAVLMERYQAGQGKVDEDQIYVWSRRALAGQIAIKTSKDDRKAAYAAHLERMKQIEVIAKAGFDAGRIPKDQVTAAMYYRIEAQIWLTQTKGGK